MMTLGIDLGGTDIKFGIMENETVVFQTSCRTPVTEGYQAVLDCLAGQAGWLLSAYPAVEFVGIGSPGLVDISSGTVLYSNNFGWNNMSLGRDMSLRLGVDVRVANDAHCAALGESLYGAGRGLSRMAMLTIGTGTGGGFVRDGRLDSDPYGSMAYIFGHMVIDHGGRQCNCGRRGCLEAYASAGAVSRASMRISPGDPLCSTECQDVQSVFMTAREGDETSVGIVNRFVEALCEGAVNIGNILRPQKIVIGGGVSGSSDMFLPQINHALENGVYGYSHAPVEAVCAQLKNRAGLIGAGSLYKQPKTP